MKSQGYTVVPCSALRPLLLEWIERNSFERANIWGNLDKGIGRLARDSGVPERRISMILSDSDSATKNVRFDTADKLLCAMQMLSEWHCSLAEFYVELEVAPYERDRDVPVLVTA